MAGKEAGRPAEDQRGRLSPQEVEALREDDRRGRERMRELIAVDKARQSNSEEGGDGRSEA